MHFTWISFTPWLLTCERSQAVPATSDYLFCLHSNHYLIKIVYYMKDKYYTRISRNLIYFEGCHGMKMNKTVSGYYLCPPVTVANIIGDALWKSREHLLKKWQ